MRVQRARMDLVLEILMAGAVLAAVAGACRRGNPRPCYWTAAGGAAISVASMIRSLPPTEILLPLIVAALAALIAALTPKFRAAGEDAPDEG
ncbi:MAG TPA: hypothetical protein VHC42_05980 [Rhizomicrobium sp.]|nr:hypothetical protein [Rhizomicrobium sp.]